MPKRVDHRQRREQIAEALLRVLPRDGLEGVSLRHVAAEAGVTAGMVQHYFPSKESMLEFAMLTARARYEQRISADVDALGEQPEPAELLSALLGGLLPADDTQADDARISLAFQSYAAVHPSAAELLAADNAGLRDHLAALIGGVRTGPGDVAAIATALLATAEGLAMHVLHGLPMATACEALDLQIRTALYA